MKSTDRNEQTEFSSKLLVSPIHDHAFFMVDSSGRITTWNESAENILGYEEWEVMGKPFGLFFAPQDVKVGKPDHVLELAYEKGYFEGYGWRLHKNGALFWTKSLICVIPDNQGFGVVLHDLTAAQSAEDALKTNAEEIQLASERTAIALSVAGVGVWEWDLANDLLIWDEQMFRLYGTTPDQCESPRATWLAALHEDDQKRVAGDLELALAGEKKFDLHFRVCLPGGEVRYLKAFGEVYRNEAGKAVRMVGANVDVTEAERFSLLTAEGTRTGIWEWPDIKTETWYWSPQLYHLLGLEPHSMEANYSNYKSLIHPDDLKPTLDAIQRHFECPQGNLVCEHRMRMKTGDYRWFLLMGTAYRNADGMPLGLTGFIHDIQETKKMEAELNEREQRLSQVMAAAPLALIMAKSDGEIVHSNKMLAKVFGYEPGELNGKKVEVLLAPHLRDEHQQQRKSYLMSPSARIMGSGRDLFGLRKDGKMIPIEVGLGPIKTQEGTFVVASIIDITERKRMETEREFLLQNLRRSNMELEQFAYVASHDLQAPLRHILSYLKLVEEGMAHKMEAAELKWFEFVRRGAQEMKTLISDLLAFSRITRGEQEFEKVNLDEMLKSLKAELAPLGSGVQINWGNLPTVVGRSTQLRQVFQNLLQNSIKFMREGVEPVIEVTAAELPDLWEISVSDNGIGIPEDSYARIFQIFQRLHTKEQYDGSGIGLSIVKKAVELHGGTVRVSSEEGRGTTFTFTLAKDPSVKALPWLNIP